MWEKPEDRNFSEQARYTDRDDNQNILTADGPAEFMWHVSNEPSEFNSYQLKWLVVDFNTKYELLKPECRVMVGNVPMTYGGTLEDMIHVTTLILYSGRPDEVLEYVNETLTLITVIHKEVQKQSEPDAFVSK
jgi:hypothetical protein